MIENNDLITQLEEIIGYLKDGDEELAYDSLRDIVDELDEDEYEEDYEDEEEDIDDEDE